jgi:hypothetical protein
MGPINVFVEAIGLVVIAYATFGVVSFLEVKNKYEGGGASGPQSDDDEFGVGSVGSVRDVQRPDMDSEDDFAEFVQTQKRNKTNKKNKPKPKKRRGGGGPRAALSVPLARLQVTAFR